MDREAIVASKIQSDSVTGYKMRKLKHYESYLNRLKTFADATGVKIIFCEVLGDGVWIPRTKTIRIDDDMSQSDTIATILHELGHSIDDVSSKGKGFEKKVWAAYEAVYERPHATKNQLDIVVKAEILAWKYGRDIAKRLKIKLGKWYDHAETTSLNDYKNTLLK